MTMISSRRGLFALAATLCGVLALGSSAHAETVGPPEALAGVEPTGACCKIDGVCTDNVTQVNCQQVGASWGGAGSTCISNICGPIGGCCVNGICDFGESRRYCEFAAGGRWYPTCGDPNCNPVGVCCIQGTCVEQTQQLCFLNGGQFFGGGTTCGSKSCDGACCLPDKAGCQDVNEAQCNALGGSFNGVGSFCGGFECPGACCYGFGSCSEVTPYDCFQSGGSFSGGRCEAVVCGSPTGACCLISGTCQDGVDFGLCIEFNGAFGGNGSTCINTDCSQAGACCVEFAPNQFFCIPNIFEDACINQQGGTFQGPGSTCSPSPCGVATPTGACCFTGGCQQFTPTQCQNVAGLYRGDHTVCTPNGCCPADFNNDGFVNTPDLTYFLGRFGRSFPPPGSEPADLVPDGVVNTLDLTRFLGAFGKQCPY